MAPSEAFSGEAPVQSRPVHRTEAAHAAVTDYDRVERAIRFIQREAEAQRQPELSEVAAHVGLSEFHFQRLFQRWAGVSPKRFLQFLTLEAAKRLLHQRKSLLETSLSVGLSGPSRLHDLFLRLEHLTPGEYKAGARGLRLRWSIAPTQLGWALFAVLDRGLCGLTFLADGEEQEALGRLRAKWPGASLQRDDEVGRHHAAVLDARLGGGTVEPLSLVLRGTPLQFRVWEALLRIPEGAVATYGQLAAAAGLPRGARAIGAAVGQNPIGYLIPCHRVIYNTGVFGHYAWGATRKAALLARELASEPE